ncbi:MAG: hypothetical protein AAFV09_16250, partial [Pseudomonadota bacterium]
MAILHRNNESAHLDRAAGVWDATATHHTPLEDVQGVLCGVLLTGLAIALYQQVGMLTGGIA